MVLKSIGLTGSNGLVGKHLIPILRKKKFIIIPTTKKGNKSFKKLDMLSNFNEKKLDSIFGKIDCLIHLASILPSRKNVSIDDLIQVNYSKTKTLIDWTAKKGIFFIFFSSLSILKKKKNKYTLLKKKIETYMLKKKNLKYLILRPSSIYGYKQKDKTLLLNKINEIKRKNSVVFFKPLSQKFNFIHAHDVCRAILFLIKKKSKGIFSVTSQKNISLKFLIQALIKVFKLKKKNIIIQNKTNIIKENSYNLDLKLQKLGWKTKINLYEGLKRSFIKKEIIF
ncbi:NAD(P)-dependent oxidoreductase [Candidatus Pelagibacter ubique]|nr:NAD(P)-dependent oxidoreductase [Candidatus Pelagibacter ubique]